MSVKKKAHLDFVETYWDKVGRTRDQKAAGGVWDKGRPVDVFPDLAAEYADRLQLQANDTVLEVGAGSGALTMVIKPKVGRVIATDISASMLAHLSGHGVETHHCDASSLPFADATFDKAYFHGVSQYFPDLDYATRAIRELIRVTKPGGRILCGDNMNGRILDDYYRWEPRGIALTQKPKYYLLRWFGSYLQKFRYGSGVRQTYLGIHPEFFGELLAGTPHRFYPMLEMVQSKPEHFLRYRYDALILLADADGRPQTL